MNWRRRDVPTLLLAAALLAAGGLLLALGWDFTFFQDTWSFLLDRQGSSAHAFLAPHNEHLVVIPVAINKLAVNVFGMTTARPELIVMTLTLLASAALLFVYVRRQIGTWLGLFAAVSLLFLGSAWQVLLWPFEIEFSGAAMAGLAMLLMLERDDRPGDVWACVLLTASIGFGSLGLSFAAAALVDVFQKRRSRGLGRLYVAAIPLLLYVVWYVGWGHEAEHHLTIHNLLASPTYVFEGLATAVGSLAGLSTTPVTGGGHPEWGRPLLVALIGLAIYWRRKHPGLSPRFWPAAALVLSFWLLAAFNFIPGREASSLRYVYAGSLFVLLLAAAFFDGVRPSRQTLWIGAAAMVLAVGPNLAQLKDGANWLKEQSVLTRADTGAMEIARRTIPSSFALSPEVAGTGSLFIVNAGQYFEAVDAHGSSAYTSEELLTAPAVGRHWADVVLAKALPVSLAAKPGATLADDPKRCVSIPGGPSPARPEVELEPGVTKVGVASGLPATFAMRRFATGEFPASIGTAPGGSVALLRIPRDNSTQPWHVYVEAQQETWFCR
jgi:hypothetical protein